MEKGALKTAVAAAALSFLGGVAAALLFALFIFAVCWFMKNVSEVGTVTVMLLLLSGSLGWGVFYESVYKALAKRKGLGHVQDSEQHDD